MNAPTVYDISQFLNNSFLKVEGGGIIVVQNRRKKPAFLSVDYIYKKFAIED
jgi:hypothetical protein